MDGHLPRYRIADLAADQRPRERLAARGAEHLSDAELIAILLGSGIRGLNAVRLAESVLAAVGGTAAGLRRIPFDELRRVQGIGPARAATLKAAAALADRFVAPADTRPVLSSPQEAAAYLQDLAHAETERLRVVLLDTRNRPVRKVDVYQGSLNSSLIRVGEVFREAVRANAASLIVAHNHPSGDPSPSPEDVAVTRAMVEAGRLLDIEVLDHLVLSSTGFVSLKARGLGF
jgi:DNA repair protein RadC